MKDEVRAQQRHKHGADSMQWQHQSLILAARRSTEYYLLASDPGDRTALLKFRFSSLAGRFRIRDSQLPFASVESQLRGGEWLDEFKKTHILMSIQIHYRKTVSSLRSVDGEAVRLVGKKQ